MRLKLRLTQGWWLPRSLLRTLLVGVGVAMAIPALLLAYVQFTRHLETEITQRVREPAQQYADVLSQGLSLALWNVDVEMGEKLVTSALGNPDVVNISVTNQFGSLFAYKEGPAQANGRLFREARELHFNGRMVGHLVLQMSEERVYQHLLQDLRQKLLGLLAQIAVSFAFMWLLLDRRFVRPLRALQEVAGRFARGELEQPLALVRQDELGRLAAALEAMRLDIATSIKLRTMAEEQLRLSEENLAITLHSIGDAVIATDPQGRITRMNATAQRLTAWPLSEALGLPLQQVFKIVNAQTRLPAVNPAHLVMQFGQVVGLANHTALLARDGQEYQIFDSAAPIRDAQQRIVGVVLVFSDVTERYRAEAALQQREQEFRAFFEVALVGLMQFSIEDGALIHYNQKFQLITGYSDEELAHHTFASLTCAEEREADWDMFNQALRGEIAEYHSEKRLLRKDGAMIWVNMNAAFVRDASGAAVRAVVVCMDITARRAAQEAVKDSLREKVSLLNEVHHRVKNNLQVIASLLRLEAGRTVHTDTKVVLKDMQGRIRAMSLLHESLYRSGVFADVDLAVYLRQLATQSYRSMVLGEQAVELVLEMDSVRVDMDVAAPCGLLVNELISNALKHGFSVAHGGVVRVFLQNQGADGNGTLALRLGVSDSGQGLAPDFEVANASSLGLQLVSDLARQLKGRLHTGAGPAGGAEFVVEFLVPMPMPMAIAATSVGA
ncbi:PAS domain S-box protein [Rhodoferax aquaticus]|uniref:histidine kinase n=1 Tax=Rhodoferax aquaticus TaxID=2527691 RepID=A0A515EK28_9BURK|nr:PAS domain S-box protein [Rhodoferax aquaticus]QDL53021.1 PAS domain S-box protein [Rhodoferax aquaticus]